MEPGLKNIHEELIDQCRSGSRIAQFELYKLYYRGMYNVSLHLVGNPADAEDIMQESFLNAFQKIGTYRGESSFGSWLKKIVVNRSLDHLKKKRISFVQVNERAMDREDDPPEGSDISPELIRQAIDRLPDGYRVVLSLYLIEGYDHETISRMLGISNSASRTQYMRAKLKLRGILKNQETDN